MKGEKLSLPAFKKPTLPKSHPRIAGYSFLRGVSTQERYSQITYTLTANTVYVVQSGRDLFNEIMRKAHVFTGLRRMKTSFKEAVKFMSASDHESLTIFTRKRTPLQSCEIISRGFNRSTGQLVRHATSYEATFDQESVFVFCRF